MLVPSYVPPQPKPLSYVEYSKLTKRLKTCKKKELVYYHVTTKYRLDIAEYCLKLLLTHYDNGIEFGAGLTGFLVQAKATLDSLSEEINLYHGLSIKRKKNWALDVKELVKNLKVLSAKNSKLAKFIKTELGNKSKWFREFKDFRDKEGVHRKRSSRAISIGHPAHSIQIDNKEVGDYCVNALAKINFVVETCYGLM